MEKNLEEKFVSFCRSNFELNSSFNVTPYNSLALCIIDCFYSLRAKYCSVTKRVIERYILNYMNGNKSLSTENCKELIKHIEGEGGFHNFAVNILKNKQQLSNRLKSEICYDVAQKLLSLKINTINDFKTFPKIDVLEASLSSIRGVGDAGLNYLFMLTGDTNRCKLDVHIHRCVKDACGVNISNKECQKLFAKAVYILKCDFPDLTISKLDSIIWNTYQAKHTNNKKCSE